MPFTGKYRPFASYGSCRQAPSQQSRMKISDNVKGDNVSECIVASLRPRDGYSMR